MVDFADCDHPYAFICKYGNINYHQYDVAPGCYMELVKCFSGKGILLITTTGYKGIQYHGIKVAWQMLSS